MNNPGMTIVAKALKDPAYRARLVADPKAAAEELGVKLPPGVVLKIVEDTASVVHLVVPVPPAKSGAISEAELSKIAGGTMPTYYCPETSMGMYKIC